MPILNQETREITKAQNPFSGRSNEELEPLLKLLEAKQREQKGTGFGGRLRNLAGTASNVFLQAGGIKPPEQKENDINNLIMKAMVEDYFKSQSPEGKLARQKAQNILGGERADAEGMLLPTPVEATGGQLAPARVEGATPTTAGDYERIPTGEYEYDELGKMRPKYKLEKKASAVAAEKRQEKIGELDVKKEQLRDDLVSFFAVDDLIDRAKGGFIDLQSAGVQTWLKSKDQPINPVTGLPDPKGAAAAAHEAASKRLRVQLVRAAGDVGNINIIEQEAAEKLIPRWNDSQATAKLKRAYLTQIAKAINSGSENDVKKALREMGVGYTDKPAPKTQPSIPTETEQGLSDMEAYREYLSMSGGK